jgi:2-hydroxychromene-2-carboxylate isomerase
MNRTMDVFFFIGSVFTYFAVMRAEQAAARDGIALRWRPFNLRAILKEQNNVPRNNPVKLAYSMRDAVRRAARHGLPFREPLPYPVDPGLRANRVASLAAAEDWCLPLARSLYTGWFRDSIPPHDPGLLSATLLQLGKVPDAILTQADAPSTHERLAAETDAARALGIFGAPTFVWGNEIFWGDDRLEDALAWAKAHPDG